MLIANSCKSDCMCIPVYSGPGSCTHTGGVNTSLLYIYSPSEHFVICECMLNVLIMAENYICIAPMSLYSDLRLTSGTEQFTSKPSEQVVHECVSGLQSASKSFPGMESVPLNLSYHPFYSALLEPEKAAEYASKVCCTSHQYQVAITFPVILSIKLTLECCLTSCFILTFSILRWARVGRTALLP